IGSPGRTIVRINVPVGLRTLRQAFYGQDRSSFQVKSAQPAGLLAHSAGSVGLSCTECSGLGQFDRVRPVAGRLVGHVVGYVQKAWASHWAQDRSKKGQLWALGCKWPRLQPFGQVMPIRLASCICSCVKAWQPILYKYRPSLTIIDISFYLWHGEEFKREEAVWLWIPKAKRKELRIVVKPRSREDSISERLYGVWVDRVRNELIIAYRADKTHCNLCIESHLI
ncbi:hypothetical protein IGI04_020139, partial [Brassica rapa subsp. trilocularis]